MECQSAQKKEQINQELTKNRDNMEESENNKKENNLELIKKIDSKINSHNPSIFK